MFQVVTKTSTHYFATLEEQEKGDWVSAFQLVAFKESAGGPAIEEDNELYCSSGEGKSGLFTSHLPIFYKLKLSKLAIHNLYKMKIV